MITMNLFISMCVVVLVLFLYSRIRSDFQKRYRPNPAYNTQISISLMFMQACFFAGIDGYVSVPMGFMCIVTSVIFMIMTMLDYSKYIQTIQGNEGFEVYRRKKRDELL